MKTIKLFFFTLVTFFIFIFCFVSLSAWKQRWFSPNALSNLAIHVAKTDFTAKESPFFIIRLPDTDGGGEQPKLLPEAKAEGSGDINDLQVQIYNARAERVDILPRVEMRVREAAVVLNNLAGFAPGKYTLRASWKNGTTKFMGSQDFTWGVVALNTDQAEYLPGDTARIAMAVLDDFGKMVCDAVVMLTITEPDGKTEVFSTQDATITVSPECPIYGVTKTADYSAAFKIKKTGTHHIALTAETQNGTRNFQDSFEVKKTLEFNVQRTGPTRLFPGAQYQMLLKIQAGKNYTGLITEYVPPSFNVTSQKGMTVARMGDRTKLQWPGRFQAGKSYQFTYNFSAPNISPEFYLLGKIKIGDWQEGRFWQMAMDAPPAKVAQNHYRWRNDNSNEANATWGGNEDTATTTIGIGIGHIKRLRLEAANTGGTAKSETLRLEWGTSSDCSSGAWTQVVSHNSCLTTSQACMQLASQLSDTSATTNVANGLTDTGTWVAGEQVDNDASTAAISVGASSFTEVEYGFQMTTSTPEKTTYYFRMSNAGTALDNGYSSCATLTTGPAKLNQIHSRWRDDFEAESGTTWGTNNEDTATTSVGISKVIRLRAEVSNPQYASSSQMYLLQYSTQATQTNDSWTTVPQTGSCGTAPFCMAASSLTEGNATTNINPGLTDGNTTFVAGLQKESNATTTHISVDTTKFTEIEWAFQVTTNASYSTDYYFRLTTTTAAGAYGQLATYPASAIKLTTASASFTGQFDAYASSTISFDTSLPVLFTSQTSTITKFGAIKIVDDRGTSAGWVLNLTGNDWKTTTGDMQLDYNGTGSDGNLGKLCANPAGGTLYAESGSLTNVTKGTYDCFSAGISAIDVITASSGYGNGTYWLTDTSLGQYIPSNPTAAVYTTTVILTLQ